MAKKKKQTPKLPPINPDLPDSKSERRAEVAQLMREKKIRARRRTIVLQALVGLVAVIAVVATTVVVLNNRGPGSSATPPPGLTADGAVRFGADDAPVVLQAVEDFQCPVCRQFESDAGDLLRGYREGTDVAVEYRPIAFLDRMSSTEYSSRALNASMCVLEASGKDAWLRYHQALFDNQPEEGGEGLPDSELVSMASTVGATSDDVRSCIEDRRYDDWAQETTDAAFDNGVSGTPTIFVNGSKLGGFDNATITSAVEDASGS
ncbi:DsbA family protein [Nocardioides sp.]|uniref:DsbA family protein n=1 Tax=Nocardioides sp. TaxID=35761 RepID=UPI003D1305DA